MLRYEHQSSCQCKEYCCCHEPRPRETLGPAPEELGPHDLLVHGLHTQGCIYYVARCDKPAGSVDAGLEQTASLHPHNQDIGAGEQDCTLSGTARGYRAARMGH